MTDNEIMNELTLITHKVNKVLQCIQESNTKECFHSGVVCWISPFGKMEHRAAWFDNDIDAHIFVNGVVNTIIANNLQYWAFLDDELEMRS